MRSIRETAAKALVVTICAVGTVGVGAATAYATPATHFNPASANGHFGPVGVLYGPAGAKR